MENASTKMKVLWMINERGDRSFWTRVGVGFVNRDGSISLQLDAMPLGTGKLQLRDYTPRDAESSNAPMLVDDPFAAPRRPAGAPDRGGRGRPFDGSEVTP